jgi:hypothetical protein
VGAAESTGPGASTGSNRQAYQTGLSGPSESPLGRDWVKAGRYPTGVNSGTTTAWPRDVILYRSSFTGW